MNLHILTFKLLCRRVHYSISNFATLTLVIAEFEPQREVADDPHCQSPKDAFRDYYPNNQIQDCYGIRRQPSYLHRAYFPCLSLFTGYRAGLPKILDAGLKQAVERSPACVS